MKNSLSIMLLLLFLCTSHSARPFADQQTKEKKKEYKDRKKDK
jgi:hypothetical protein